MNREIILKDDEKEYLLQRIPEDSPARSAGDWGREVGR
jgi:hypothetical protein